MRTIRYKILVLICMFTMVAKGQIVTKNNAFKVGEEFVLDAYFNLGLLWMKVGTATFTVGEENGNYLFTVKAHNYPKWDFIYKMSTLHVASCTKDMKPLYMWCKVHDKEDYYEDRYDFTDKKDHYEIHRHTIGKKYPDGHDTVYSLPLEAHDIINAIYVARNADLTVNGGVMIPFSPIFHNKVFPIYGNVLEKEVVKTREGEKYDCRKYSAIVGEGTMVDNVQPVYIYATDDERKIPVLVETKLKIGRVKVYLKSYQVKGEEETEGEK